MMVAIIEQALNILRPGVRWELPGEMVLSNVVWPVGEIPPTQAEFDAAVSQVMSTDSSRSTVSCSRWQIRKALNQLGLRNAVEAAVAAGSQDLKDGWEFADEFRSDDPMVLEMGAALGKSPEEIREVIALAITL